MQAFSAAQAPVAQAQRWTFFWPFPFSLSKFGVSVKFFFLFLVSLFRFLAFSFLKGLCLFFLQLVRAPGYYLCEDFPPQALPHVPLRYGWRTYSGGNGRAEVSAPPLPPGRRRGAATNKACLSCSMLTYLFMSWLKCYFWCNLM